MPPLAAVYLRQQATQRANRRGNLADEEVLARPSRASSPADEVLAEGMTCVVLAGPGGGKSSLLRTRLAHGVEHCLHGRSEVTVPVLVPAAALPDRPLAQALAAAATADLAGHGLVEVLPTEFFAAAPCPGARWLVLVDGLDEITDSAARRRLLSSLAAVSQGEHAQTYRFVITTRLLPENELDVLGLDVPRYDLEPFSHADLERVAEGWFRVFQLPDPSQAAAGFMKALARTWLTDLVRVPLMASMLCQIHADAPADPLPTTRGQIYDAFIAALHRRQHTPGSPAVAVTDRSDLARYGRAAQDQAERTLDHLQDLLAYLAAERRSGNEQPAAAVLESQPEASRPRRVPAEDWRDFLNTCLLRSGLLTVRASQLVFLHQTLQEHLAAWHATRDEQACRRALRELFPSTDEPTTHPFDVDASYQGFLLDKLLSASSPAAAATSQFLEDLDDHPQPSNACDFLVAQVELKTRLPVAITARHLASFADRTELEGRCRLKAAWALTEMEGQFDTGQRLAVGLAEDSTLEPDFRLHAVELLAGIGDDRANALYNRLARTSELGGPHRLEAAGHLVEREGYPSTAPLLHELVLDTSMDGHGRVLAAQLMAFFADPQGTNLLSHLADDHALDGSARLLAACYLTEHSAQRGAPPSTRHDITPEWQPRLLSASHFFHKNPRDAAQLARLADDASLDGPSRVRSAWHLTKQPSQRKAGAELLIRLADDPDIDSSTRLSAARYLTALPSHTAEGVHRLTLLSDDANHNVGAAARRHLAYLAQARARDDSSARNSGTRSWGRR